jgi:ribonuclease BN (tRNA processing enzyme)
MAGLGLDWMGITHVFLTHFHADHISDLPTLMYAWRYGAIPYRTTDANMIGPPGFLDLFDRIDAAFGGDLRQLGFPVNLVELGDGADLRLSPDVSVSARKVPHTAESVAYSVQAGRRRVVYTGDTSFDLSLAEWAKGCDVLLMECSLPESMSVPAHMTPEQCGEFAALARPTRLVLTHLFPPLDRIDVAGIVATRYDGPVQVAYDGWTVELED